MRNRSTRWVVVVLAVIGLPILTIQVGATPSGCNSEKQTLLTVDKSNYSVLSHYFIVVRSYEWASDAGNFEHVITTPNP